jgi:hypothetical protein
MDKNIAAFMRDNAKTISVRFFKDVLMDGDNLHKDTLCLGDKPAAVSNKQYTYVTDLDFAVGDYAVVLVYGVPKCVIVTEVHEDLNIDPNDTIEYKWVVQKISFEAYQKMQEDNKKLTDIIKGAYKQNVRQQFRQLLLSTTSAQVQEQIQAVLTPKEQQ